MEKAKVGSWVRLLVLLGACLVLLAVVCSSFLGNIRPFALWDAQLGVPKIVREEIGMIHSEILQVLSEGDRLYLLHRNGVVQVYDAEGSYRYSVGFYAHPNGRFGMALADGELVVQDRVGNCYFFSGDEFDRFADRRDAESVRLNWDRSTEGYEIRNGSVWYTPEGGEAGLCIGNLG